MPTFTDWHMASELDDNRRRELQERVRSREPDEHGVVDPGIIFDRDADRMYCILDAPDEDAVRRHHQDVGVPLETVHRADTIL